MTLVAIFILFFSVTTDCDDMQIIRELYHKISTENDLTEFIDLLENSSCDQSKIEPFIASSIMQKSEHAFITKKMKYFKEGKIRLEDFISKNPNHLEAKYIRYLIQSEIPSFLNYDSNIVSDSLFIAENIETSNLPKDYQNLIIKNLNR